MTSLSDLTLIHHHTLQKVGCIDNVTLPLSLPPPQYLHSNPSEVGTGLSTTRSTEVPQCSNISITGISGCRCTGVPQTARSTPPAARRPGQSGSLAQRSSQTYHSLAPKVGSLPTMTAGARKPKLASRQ